jgi:tRNA-dihydrouridine synthase B
MIDIKGKLFIAPLAGYSDPVFRKLNRRFGADITVSEMISVKAALFRQKKTLLMADADPEGADRPYGIQLFGSEPEEFGYAASVLQERVKPEFFDINCGCPVRKVLRQKSGSWLLTDPPRIRRIVEAVKKAVPSVPVSAKIRLGFDDKKNHRETAQAAADGGADFLVVHARTRPQLFSGPPDLDAIRELKAMLTIPVVGNGGVRDTATWKAMVEAGADAVMIGLGAIGRPWVFSEIAAARDGREWTPPSTAEQIDIFYGHMKEFCERVPGQPGVTVSRCYAMQYIKNILRDRPGIKDFLRRYSVFKEWAEIELFIADMRRFCGIE